MKLRGYGRIVNIASIAGKEGKPNASAYSASKGDRTDKIIGQRGGRFQYRCELRHTRGGPYGDL